MSWLRRRMMANVVGIDPYAGFTFGYGIDRDGELYANSNMCVSDYIAIPAGITAPHTITWFGGPYTTGQSAVGDMCLCFYDAQLNKVSYWTYAAINRSFTNSQDNVAYVRASFYIPTLDTSFLRLASDVAPYPYYDLFAGISFPSEYRDILYGYYYDATSRSMKSNISREGLGSSCCVGYYQYIHVPENCNSVRMNIYSAAADGAYGRIVFLNSDGTYANYWAQNSVNRVVTDTRIGSVYKFFYKNTFNMHLDTTYVYDMINSNYLFKGISV